MTQVRSQTLGYPRIGKNREVKKALESYWKGKLDAETLLQTVRDVEREGWETQLAAGIDRIGVGDATLYDHVLDWAYRLGLIPARFAGLEGLDQYFAMARGAPGVPALELTKWFDTNYHYLVPEVEAGIQPQANFTDYLSQVQRAQAVLGERAAPIILGPVTLLRLSRLEEPLDQILERLLPLYQGLLDEMEALGVPEVQFHEPALVLGDAAGLQGAYQTAYGALQREHPKLNLVTYFDDLGEALGWVLQLPIDVLCLDFTRGTTLESLKTHAWPEGLILGAGLVDARSVWQIRPNWLDAQIEQLADYAPFRVGASSSLQFVPYQASREDDLPAELREVLAFAEEKLREIDLLARRVHGEPAGEAWDSIRSAWERFRAFAPAEPSVQSRLEGLTEGDFERALPYADRKGRQVELPPFPTTTIGSFPQTVEVRRLRGRFKRGEISREAYEAGIDAWIGYTLGAQEAMGLDVLVHGEFERSDMVEYFAEKMQGFAFTKYGWVQSYGSRYVRPPIIYADVLRPKAMTVREFEVAQSFTKKPIKGMLTGPVTILNWSYPRTDISRREIALQIALALRDEIADLEAAEARIIQVDEPALREGLPFKPERWQEYLDWAVDAFRLATGGASPEIQVHTHMCYSEFGDVLKAIDRLNADVISIENARSDDETLHELAQYGYARQVGPGVYDVHSPVVPDKEQIKAKLRTFLKHLEADQIWVNPDCGLKTRGWKEVLPSLNHIVDAVEELREELELEPGSGEGEKVLAGALE